MTKVKRDLIEVDQQFTHLAHYFCKFNSGSHGVIYLKVHILIVLVFADKGSSTCRVLLKLINIFTIDRNAMSR